jgi:PAS domain S-box-containing protein
VSSNWLGWVVPSVLVGLVAVGGSLAIRAVSAWPGAAEFVAAALLAALGSAAVALARRAQRAEAVVRQYREVLEVAADGLMGVDGRERIALVGRKTAALLGYEPGELLGLPLRDILPGLGLTPADCQAADPAQGRQEVAARRTDGAELVLECRTGPPLAAAGPLRATLVLRDVTGARRTKELLRARDTHLRMVVEQMPAILWITDRDLRITSTLGAGLSALNVRPEELIGVTMLESLGKDDPHSPPIAAHLRAVGGQSLSYEMEWRGRAFQVRVDPLRNSAGAVVGTVGIMIDVTQHRQALADLHQAEQKQRRLVAILEATPDVVAIADRDHRLSYLNAAGRALLGLARDADVSNRCLADLFPDDLRILTMEEIIPAAVADGVWSGEGALRGSAGRRAPVSQVVLAHRDPGGDVQFLSLVARDVTAQRRLEEQLRHAQKMEALGRLASGVAHDFNNLLTVIHGFVGLLCSRLPQGEPLYEYADQIQRAADRATWLTRQLLAFGRKQVLAPRTLNLNGLVADMEKFLRRLISEDIELVVLLEPTLHPIHADAGQVEHLLLNLAANARDAMQGGGTLTVTTSNVDLGAGAHVRPGSYVRLSVSDTGVGMTEEVRARLFEPFFTTKETGKGTGLGLASVHGIVEQSGGHVEVNSAPGRGTTFHIYLPRHEEVAHLLVGDPAVMDIPGGNETVLLVEDEDGVRHLAREALGKKGYAVLEARDGVEALSVAAGHPGPIHLLVTDAVMPKLGGGALAQRLASARPETRVLFLSGFTESALLGHGVRPGEVDCLFKPFQAKDLAEAVRRILDAPSNVRAAQERRQTLRRRPAPGVAVECRRRQPGGGLNLAQQVADLSPDGAGLVVASALALGERVDLTLSTPHRAAMVRVSAEVVWATRLEDGRYRAGLRLHQRLGLTEFLLLT